MQLLKVLVSFACSTFALGITPLSVSRPDWPPYSIINGPGHHPGYLIEITNQCFSDAGYQPNYRELPIKRMFNAMKKGDLLVNVMSYKRDRAEFLAFGKIPLFRGEYVAFTNNKQTTLIKNIDDLNGLSLGDFVGIRPSDSYRTYLDLRLKKRDAGGITVVHSVDSLIKMLAKGRIDAFVGNKAEILWRAKALGLSSFIKASGLTVETQDYFWTVAKNGSMSAPTIITKLDRCVKDLTKSGRIREIKRRYRID